MVFGFIFHTTCQPFSVYPLPFSSPPLQALLLIIAYAFLDLPHPLARVKGASLTTEYGFLLEGGKVGQSHSLAPGLYF